MNWNTERMRIAGLVKRMLDEGFTRREIIEAHKEGILEELVTS